MAFNAPNHCQLVSALTSLFFSAFSQHLHFAFKISMFCVRLLKYEKETNHYNYGL